jgi:hypothetical protein
VQPPGKLVGPQPARLTCGFDCSDPSQKIPENQLEVHTSKLRADAEVRPSPAERHVVKQVSIRVEHIGIRKMSFVVIGRSVGKQNLVSGCDLLAPEFMITRCRTAESHDWATPPQEFFNKNRRALLSAPLVKNCRRLNP